MSATTEHSREITSEARARSARPPGSEEEIVGTLLYEGGLTWAGGLDEETSDPDRLLDRGDAGCSPSAGPISVATS
jgi:hypothetical protein